MEELKEELLRLITEDRTFRLAVAGALGLAEVLERIEKLDEDVAENTKAIRALQEEIAENSRAIRALQEQVRALQEQVADHSRAIKALQEQVRTLQEQVAEHTRAIKVLQEQVVEHTKAIRALQEQVTEHSRAIRALQEQIAEHSAAIKAVQEQVKVLQEQVTEHTKALIEHSEAIRALQVQIVDLSRAVRDLSRTVAAVGARWGLLAEEAFREAMRNIVEGLFGGKVERWIHFDEEGAVFGHPSIIEVDLVVRDDVHVLVEVKSSVSRGDVRELLEIGRLYERVRGVKPKPALVSPYVEPKALEIARKLGVEVYTGTALEFS